MKNVLQKLASISQRINFKTTITWKVTSSFSRTCTGCFSKCQLSLHLCITFTEFLFSWNSYLRGVLHTKLSPERLNPDIDYSIIFSSNLILFLTYLKSTVTPLCQHTKYCIFIHYIHSTNSSNRKLQSSIDFFFPGNFSPHNSEIIFVILLLQKRNFPSFYELKVSQHISMFIVM